MQWLKAVDPFTGTITNRKGAKILHILSLLVFELIRVTIVYFTKEKL